MNHEQIKNEAAKARGYSDWEELLCMEDGPISPDDVDGAVDQIVQQLQEENETLKRTIKFDQASLKLVVHHAESSESEVIRLREVLKESPIRLRDLAITYDVFLIIKNNTINNGTVVADRMMRSKDEIHGDFFHSKQTNEHIAERNAINLTIKLLSLGYKIVLTDGDWSVLKSTSPPLYDKYISALSSSSTKE